MPSSPSTSGPWVLVLDVGSSSVRANLFGPQGRSLPPNSEMRRRYRWRTVPEGAMECDPHLLVREIERVIEAAMTQVRGEGIEVVAVAAAAFWHSVMGLGRDGEPVTPIYGWGDTRAGQVALELQHRFDERSLHRRTGCFFHPSYPSVKLAWLRRQCPDAFARSTAWVSFPEYLEETLLGQRRCSTSMASGSGLMDVRLERWDDEALDIAGITRAQLPALVDASEGARGLRAEYAARWPELTDVPWFPPLGDGACANAGSGAVGPELPGLTVGTSAAVRALWEPQGEVPIPDDLWCYRLDRRWWVAGGALSNGGNAVAYLRRTLLLGASAEVDSQVAALAPDAHGLTILPFLRGERGPGWTREKTATVAGMGDTTRPEEILRAWLEAVAYRIARVERRLEEIVGPAREVVASGGALHSSSAWTQILADVLDRPLSLSTEREDTSRGAALMALESLGLIPGLRGVDPPTGRHFNPDPAAHESYRLAMDRQQRLLKVLSQWEAAEAPRGGDW